MTMKPPAAMVLTGTGVTLVMPYLVKVAVDRRASCLTRAT
jgi:hypothetical protein